MVVSALPDGPRRPSGDFRGNVHCEAMERLGVEPRARFRRPLLMAQAVVGGVAVCALVFLGLDVLAPHLKPERPPAFLWTSADNGATVFYKREPVLRLHGRDGFRATTRAQRLAASLDSLFNQIHSPRLEAASAQVTGRGRDTGQVARLPSEHTCRRAGSAGCQAEAGPADAGRRQSRSVQRTADIRQGFVHAEHHDQNFAKDPDD